MLGVGLRKTTTRGNRRPGTWKTAGGVELDESMISLPYRVAISMYRHPPVENVKLPEFEQFGFDRLKVLKELHSIAALGMSKEARENRVEEVLRRHLRLKTYEDVRKDVISHFVCRLAFCHPKHREWFLARECALLQHRLEHETTVQEFIKQNLLSYEPISTTELRAVRDDLATTARANGATASVSYYKVPWTMVLRLVRSRRVYIDQGFAFVPQSEIIELVLNQYRTFLYVFPLFAALHSF